MVKAKVLNNLESVGDMMGSLEGISEGMDSKEYMQSLIEQAHGQASNAFDVAAAATAAAGHLQHVYEFGVTGITQGKPKFPNPLDQSARLWIHTIRGQGGQQDIGYTFRPAFNRNPQPTTASTGVPSKYLRKLSRRKYVFWNKAFVMETGQTVINKAKRGDFLFVPFNGKPAQDTNNKRGFVLWNSNRLGPIQTVPGQTTKGTFTAFWLRWWGSQGQEIIEDSMRQQLSIDIRKANEAAARKAEALAMKPVQSVNPVAASNKAKAREYKKFVATNTRGES